MQEDKIAKEVQEIEERAEARKTSGSDEFYADWQASLEILLLMMQEHLSKNPGQMLPMQIDSEEEWEFYIDIEEKLDLPPDTCAVLITPSAFRDMPILEKEALEEGSPEPWEHNAYSILISGCQDRKVVMQVSLPGMESVGVDVFEEGNHIANYTYNTIEECLDDLTKVTWIHLNPKADWTEEEIIRYTQNWYAKTLLTFEIRDVPIHAGYSYLHHPELIDLTPLDAIFKVIGATIPKEYDSLEKAIQLANDINQDMDLGYPLITKEGILNDDMAECQALLTRIVVEIDQHLDLLEYVEGIAVHNRSIKNPDFDTAFDNTARELYRTITGRPCPKGLKFE